MANLTTTTNGSEARIVGREVCAAAGRLGPSFVIRAVHLQGRLLPRYADDRRATNTIRFWSGRGQAVVEKFDGFGTYIPTISHGGRQRDVPGVV